MKKVILVNIRPVYIDNNTCQPVTLTPEERLLHYKARSMNYTDIKTKQSFAHFEQRYTNSVNLDKLQKIRGNYFVYDKGRIWDL